MNSALEALLMTGGEILVSIVAAGVALLMLPILTFGRLRAGIGDGKKIYTRKPNGQIVVDAEFAGVMMLLLAGGIFIAYQIWGERW
jgi:hypothetical protein